MPLSDSCRPYYFIFATIPPCHTLIDAITTMIHISPRYAYFRYITHTLIIVIDDDATLAAYNIFTLRHYT